jgi:hypothetical protein
MATVDECGLVAVAHADWLVADVLAEEDLGVPRELGTVLHQDREGSFGSSVDIYMSRLPNRGHRRPPSDLVTLAFGSCTSALE